MHVLVLGAGQLARMMSLAGAPLQCGPRPHIGPHYRPNRDRVTGYEQSSFSKSLRGLPDNNHQA